jgi:hypothetical protein
MRKRSLPNGGNFKMIQQIPSIKIINKGETYYISRATDMLNRRQPLNEEQEGSTIKEIEIGTMQKQEENIRNNELSYQDESWKKTTSNRKRKIIPDTSAIKA